MRIAWLFFCTMSTRMENEIINDGDTVVLPDDEITPAQRKIGELKQFAYAIIACLSNLIFGCHIANTSITIQALSSPEAYIFMDQTQQSIFATIPPIFGLLGGFLVSPVVSVVGPRSSVIVCLALSLTGAALIVSAQNPAMLQTARALNGVGDGAVVLGLSTYLRDIAETSIRGRILMLPLFAKTIGIIFCYFLGSFMSWWSLQMLLLCATVIVIICTFLIPESPMWYNTKGRIENAKTSLKKVRPEGYDVDDELQNIPPPQKQRPYFTLLMRLFRKIKYVKPFLFMFVINILEHLCAVVITLNFGTVLLGDVGDVIDPSMASSIITMAQLTGICAAFLLIDRIGRKPLLMLSGLIMALTWLAFAVLTYLKYNRPSSVENKEYLKFLVLFVNMLGSGLGLRIIPTILLSETIPKEVNAVGISLICGLKLLSSSVVMFLFLYMMKAYEQGEIFFMYFVFCVLAVLVSHFFITETNQKTLREIEALFEKKRVFFELIVPSMKTLEMKIQQFDDAMMKNEQQDSDISIFK